MFGIYGRVQRLTQVLDLNAQLMIAIDLRDALPKVMRKTSIGKRTAKNLKRTEP